MGLLTRINLWYNGNMDTKRKPKAPDPNEMSLDELLGGVPSAPVKKTGRPRNPEPPPPVLSAADKERLRLKEDAKVLKAVMHDAAGNARKPHKFGEGEDPFAPVNPLKINGGKREGAGQKDKETQDLTRDSHVLYTESRAKLEQQKALMAELDFNIKSGEYVSRESVRQATSKAFAVVSQSLRSIPDNLERRTGVSPEASLRVGIMIDDVLADLANDLEKLHKENAE